MAGLATAGPGGRRCAVLSGLPVRGRDQPSFTRFSRIFEPVCRGTPKRRHAPFRPSGRNEACASSNRKPLRSRSQSDATVSFRVTQRECHDETKALTELEVAQGSYCPAGACLDRGSIAFLHQTTSFQLLTTRQVWTSFSVAASQKANLTTVIRIRSDRVRCGSRASCNLGGFRRHGLRRLHGFGRMLVSRRWRASEHRSKSEGATSR